MERETWYSEEDDDGDHDVSNRSSITNTFRGSSNMKDNNHPTTATNTASSHRRKTSNNNHSLPHAQTGSTRPTPLRVQEGGEIRYHPSSYHTNTLQSPKNPYNKNNSSSSSGGGSGTKKHHQPPSIFDSIDSTTSVPPLARPKHQIPPR